MLLQKAKVLPWWLRSAKSEEDLVTVRVQGVEAKMSISQYAAYKVRPWTITPPEDRIACDRCGQDNSKGQFFVSCPKCNAKHVCIDCATEAEVDLGYCTEHLQAGIDTLMTKVAQLQRIVKDDTAAFRSMLAVQTKPPSFRLGQLQGIAQTRLWAREGIK